MKFLKSKKIIAVLLILSATISEFVLAFLYNEYNSNVIFPEILYYSSQIITSIFVISGVVIAVWQYYLSSKSTKTDLEIQQVQRAIDLSEYYKDNILKFYPAIKYIFRQTGIDEIVNTLRIDQLHDFDIHELHTLFSPDQINKLKEIQESDTFSKKALEASIIYGLSESNKFTNTSNTVIIAYISNMTDSLLNNMEFFALHFTHQTADESVVYQSLHQTYLDIVHDMYYDIAERNNDPTSKFYTNIISLFNIWRNKKSTQNSERSKTSLSIQSTGTIINQQ